MSEFTISFLHIFILLFFSYMNFGPYSEAGASGLGCGVGALLLRRGKAGADLLAISWGMGEGRLTPGSATHNRERCARMI
jgi:hypothetical protein